MYFYASQILIFESGRSELFRATTIDQPELSIPLRYDHENGGFWLDYVLSDGNENSHSRRALLAAFHYDKRALSTRAKAGELNWTLTQQQILFFMLTPILQLWK